MVGFLWVHVLTGRQTLSLAKLSLGLCRYLMEKLRCCSQSLVLCWALLQQADVLRCCWMAFSFSPLQEMHRSPVKYLFFKLVNHMHCIYAPPRPPNLLWNWCCCSHRKEGFHCCCCSVFLVSCSMLFRQSPFPFPFHLAPWPVFFSEPPELIDFLAYLYYFSVIRSISHPPLRMRKLPQQQWPTERP